jgi:hypothetical protein
MRADYRITDKELHNSVGLNAMLKVRQLKQQSKKFLAVG